MSTPFVATLELTYLDNSTHFKAGLTREEVSKVLDALYSPAMQEVLGMTGYEPEEVKEYEEQNASNG